MSSRLNLVHVSSIFPPMCKIIPKDEGVKLIAPGSIAFCVMARQASNERARLIASSIGCAIPVSPGFRSRHKSYLHGKQEPGDEHSHNQGWQ